jgi:hypothetical protein
MDSASIANGVDKDPVSNDQGSRNNDSLRYEQKLRNMTQSQLQEEFNTVKWHYVLFKNQKNQELVMLVEAELARRRNEKRQEPLSNNELKSSSSTSQAKKAKNKK